MQDTVNVKLSDYGISRQSFHEGALGVEGTPGYQAPEIRPGIVYDEKVSAFFFLTHIRKVCNIFWTFVWFCFMFCFFKPFFLKWFKNHVWAGFASRKKPSGELTRKTLVEMLQIQVVIVWQQCERRDFNFSENNLAFSNFKSKRPWFLKSQTGDGQTKLQISYTVCIT